MDWLTLSEASTLLGIHPITLRSWVDAGSVRAFRTPGGHRRFRRGELLEFMEQQRTAPEQRALVATADQTLERIRTEMGSSPMRESSWYIQLSDEERARQREMGQRLLGLLLQYVSRQENGGDFLQEARQLAQQYGVALANARLGASDLARAFLFFRHMVINATYHPSGTPKQTDTDGVRLLQRINAFMDELLIATLEAYDGVMQPRTAAVDALTVKVNPRSQARSPQPRNAARQVRTRR
jgi:excisionase family DNA binding protein